MQGNQKRLLAGIDLLFRLAEQNDYAIVGYTYARAVNKGQNRIEVRHCWAIAGEESLRSTPSVCKPPGMKTLVKVRPGGLR